MMHISSTIFISRLFIGLIMLTCSAFATGQVLDQAKVIGAYLTSTDISAKLKQSPCGYILKKKELPTLKSRIEEVRANLRGNDLKEYNTFVNSSEFEKKMAKNQDFIDGYLLNIKKDGLDEKTACGLLVGFTTPPALKAESDWRELSRK